MKSVSSDSKKLQNRMFFISFVMIIFGIVFWKLCSSAVANDGFWHLKMGRWMLENKLIPHYAVGAWGGEDLYWLPQEWLYQVILSFITGNSVKVAWILSMCMWLVIYFMIGIFTKIYDNIFLKPFSLLLFGAGLFFAMISYCTPRPQVISTFMIVVFVHWLRQMLMKKQATWKDYIKFFLLSVLWSNLHAGCSILGYLIPLGVVLCYTIVDAVKNWKGDFLSNYFDMSHEDKSLHNMTWVCVVMLLGNFCTPNGIMGFLYPYVSMRDGLMLSVITEWASPDFNSLTGILFFYIPVFLLILWVYFTRRKKIVFYDILIMGFFILMTLMHIRMVSFMLATICLLVIPYFPTLDSKNEKHSKQMVPVWVSSLLIVVSIVFFMVGVPSVALNREGLDNDEFFETVRQEAGERLFNYYDIGSILQYKDIPVFIDARYDPFAEDRMHDFVYIQSLDSNSEKLSEILMKYDFTSFLDIKDSSSVLWASQHGYELVSELDTGTMYKNWYGQEESLIYEFWVKKPI